MEHQFTGTVTDLQDRSFQKDGQTKKVTVARIEESNPTNVDYPEALAVEFFEEKVKCPSVGETVTVTYNVKARLYEGKIYGSNNAWKVANLDANGQGDTSTPQTEKVAENGLKQPIGFESDPNDDLPF